VQGVTVRLADRVTPKVPEMTAVPVVTTGASVITKFAEIAPWGMVTDAGTVAAAELDDERATVAPPAGAVTFEALTLNLRDRVNSRSSLTPGPSRDRSMVPAS